MCWMPMMVQGESSIWMFVVWVTTIIAQYVCNKQWSAKRQETILYMLKRRSWPNMHCQDLPQSYMLWRKRIETKIYLRHCMQMHNMRYNKNLLHLDLSSNGDITLLVVYRMCSDPDFNTCLIPSPVEWPLVSNALTCIVTSTDKHQPTRSKQANTYKTCSSWPSVISARML